MLAPFLQRSRLWQLIEAKRGRDTPVRGPVYLPHRRIYILPTRAGIAFAVALLLMLIGSINYQLSLGYMMTFLLAGMGTVAMLHTYRNLVHVRIDTGRIEGAFAGGAARFHLHLHNPGHYERIAIEIQSGGTVARCDIRPRDDGVALLAIAGARRGWLALPRLTVQTRYPLGLFRAWAYAHPDARALIYPRPDDAPLPPPEIVPAHGGVTSAARGNDDFQGLRAYQAGDSLRQIAWKSAAHSETLQTKVFSGQGTTRLWFDYARLPREMDMEARLSRLTGHVLRAAEAGATYGLRLPQRTIEPAAGEAHRDACLRALALYGLA